MNMSERMGGVSDFARAGVERQKTDLADPERAHRIQRVRELLNRILTSGNDDLIEAYVDFSSQLPKDVRITHYFIGSTPAADLERFDSEDGAVLQKIESFAKERGL